MNVIYHVKWLSPNDKGSWVVEQQTCTPEFLGASISVLIDTGAVIIAVEPVVPR